MSDIGPVEQWVRRWGNPNESGDRVWFTGEIETFDSIHPELGPDIIVPLFDFARTHDAEDANLAHNLSMFSRELAATQHENDRLRTVLRQAGEALRKHGRHGHGCFRTHYGRGGSIEDRPYAEGDQCNCGLYAAIAAIEALEVRG